MTARIGVVMEVQKAIARIEARETARDEEARNGPGFDDSLLYRAVRWDDRLNVAAATF